ncbi:gamma-glutamyltransferase [Gammaproteobacteria bacterium]|nr:gamma-glutamyltransferase [Gammaproteobacteria bacterium]MDB0065770.1 gamma-glutamyltransferase [Gammaproteobacteria bacterium]MDC1443252.1 gamma-glutamyltransferase [Gammaproteobacteria bacterium]
MKNLNKIYSIILATLFCSTLSTQSFTAIGTVNPAKYIPEQKMIAFGSNGMVTTQHYLATKVGEDILNQGGNAYDAAIAISFTLAVVLPRAGNIGGGGFMVLHDIKSKKNYAIDYREKAPLLSTTDMYLDENGTVIPNKSTLGYLSSGVPGTVAGMWAVHQKFGSMKWEKLIRPAIKLASDGFEISPYMSDMLIKYNAKLSVFEETKNIFQKQYPIFNGESFVQVDLAETLSVIADNGRDGFYKGSVAKKIADDMSKNGGIISIKDLEEYEPKWRDPLVSEYRNTKIVTMPPPSSGGVHIIQMLNILENFDLNSLGHNSKEYINILGEVMKYAYADRSKYLGDPDYFNVPIKNLSSKAYANNIFNKIKIGKVMPSTKIKPGNYLDTESNETTHFSVVDSHGNIVSSTYTLNSSFGSGVVIKGTGILMNNEMDDFSVSPGVPNQYGLLGAKANEIIPNKRPLSSMTPTIGFKDGDFYFTTGSPGGAKIISAVLQSILNMVDFDMNVEDAIKARRVHHQWQPDLLQIEFNIEDNSKNWLLNAGYNIKIIEPQTNLQLIMKKNGSYYGYGDFRRPDSYASGDIK